jgi:hypothetical protein
MARGDGDVKLPMIGKTALTQQTLEEEDLEEEGDVVVEEEEDPFEIKRVALKFGANYKGEGKDYQVSNMVGGKRKIQPRQSVLDEMREPKFGLLKVKEDPLIEDPKVLRRRQLLATLPQIENDAETAKFMINKFSDLIVGSHADLDDLHKIRVERQRTVRLVGAVLSLRLAIECHS